MVYRLLDTAEMIEPTRPVLSRAAQPLPTALGTLDAIHLATALLWREQGHADLVMATHDEALATAAKASGFRVVGIVARIPTAFQPTLSQRSQCAIGFHHPCQF